MCKLHPRAEVACKPGWSLLSYGVAKVHLVTVQVHGRSNVVVVCLNNIPSHTLGHLTRAYSNSMWKNRGSVWFTRLPQIADGHGNVGSYWTRDQGIFWLAREEEACVAHNSILAVCSNCLQQLQIITTMRQGKGTATIARSIDSGLAFSGTKPVFSYPESKAISTKPTKT